MKLLCKSYRVINRIHHNKPSQKAGNHAVIDMLRMHQLTCHADHPGMTFCPLISCVVSALHTGQGQKRRAAKTVFLQVIDEPLCGLLILCHNVLDAAAKRSLHRCLIGLFHFDQIRHNAMDAGNLVLFLHDPTHTSAVALIPLRYVLQRLQPRLLFVEGGSGHFQ